LCILSFSPLPFTSLTPPLAFCYDFLCISPRKDILTSPTQYPLSFPQLDQVPTPGLLESPSPVRSMPLVPPKSRLPFPPSIFNPLAPPAGASGSANTVSRGHPDLTVFRAAALLKFPWFFSVLNFGLLCYSVLEIPGDVEFVFRDQDG